jgi:hypothetical protein
MLGSYYTDRHHERNNKSPYFFTKMWLSFNVFLFFCLILTYIDKSTEYMYYANLHSNPTYFCLVIIFFLAYFLIGFLGKSEAELEELYMSDYMEYKEAWCYSFLPFLVIILVFIFVI